MKKAKLLCGLAVMTLGLSACAQQTKPIEQVNPERVDMKQKPLMRDFMGINAHTIQFDPKLYAPLCRLVRDYHAFGWDVGGSSANETIFPLTRAPITWKAPPGKFRDFSGQVNWDELYGAWQTEGFEIDVCVQFGELTVNKWVNVEEDSYRYGKAFAAAFGPSGKFPRATSIEIGNEPAGNKRFSPEDFKRIHVNMARGIRETDPKLTIVTCTVESGKPDNWSMPLDMFADIPDLYDVINVHKYAHPPGSGMNPRSYPEDPKIPFLSTLQDSIDWRDQHAPDKPVWITEFGYDASTKPPLTEGKNANYPDVTDEQQARWIVRSFLVFAEMDFDRAYLYWFNDSDTPTPHAASGVTRNFEPKMSYWAMKHLYQSLGDCRFVRVVEKSEGGAYVYEFADGSNANRLVWVAWSATGDDRSMQKSLALPGKLVKAQRMPMSEKENINVALKQQDNKSVEVTLGESPVYLWIQR